MYGILEKHVSSVIQPASFRRLISNGYSLVPAVLIGMLLGPIAAKFLDAKRWGSAAEDQQDAITLGVMRVMIGIQL